jgi:tetratricopeptide (TPR) repeat protein
MALLKFALEIALQEDLPVAALRAYNNLASTLGWDKPAEAAGYGQSHLALARKLGMRGWEWQGLNNLAWINSELGHLDLALEQIAQIASPDEEPGAMWSWANANSSAAVIHGWRGEFEEADRLLGRVEPFLTGTSDVQNRSIFDWASGEVQAARGDYRAALEIGERGFKASMSLGFQDVAPLLFRAVDSAVRLGEVKKAQELMAIVEPLPAGRPGLLVEGELAKVRALLAIATGDGESVEPQFRVAEARLREVGTPLRLALVLLEHGEWLVAQGRQDEGGPLLVEAREIFERLGAKPSLERVDQVEVRARVTTAAQA